MKLASCDNCAHRQESTCSLRMQPEAGEFLCPKYAMCESFRQEVLGWARQEIAREVNQAMLNISVMRAEKQKAYAG
jgi:adenosyl cobinamide kinase/adenosyl cobinamide phosphate guanylyltransferase